MQQISYRLSDMALPLIVVSMMALMILPLPVVILDTLLMVNIAFSISLIITSVYLTNPERFTSLPSILLLSTVFRLALNIATTRQLLTHGVAPKIVAAFGQFVVSGNLVVGLAIFSIITVVQFIVIAKGAERIAEVAARFTLDALPGKQMAIDADVRSGFVSLAEARSRRIELQREAKLFGALDGAMKFVKGDAIAGILMIGVNILAGFIVGVTQHRLSFGEAAVRYTIFTVGDGLVAQIPALLVAVAAGIAVTRVAERDGSLLGRDLLSQLVSQPQAIVTTAVILSALAFIPGLPAAQFVMASVFLLYACKRVLFRQRLELQHQLSEFEARPEPGLKLALGSQIVRSVDLHDLSNRLQRIREQMFADLGIVLPEFLIEQSSSISDREYRLCSRGALIVKRVASESSETPNARSAEIEKVLTAALHQSAPDLLDDTQTRILLEIFEPLCEDLINSVVPGKFSVTEVTRILRRLLQERIPLRELHSVLQALAESVPMRDETKFPREDYLLGEVRVALRRTISERVSDSSGYCHAWTLSRELDATLSAAALRGLNCDPALAQSIAAAIHSARSNDTSDFVLLTSRFARSILALALKSTDANITIITADELVDEVRLVVQGEIGLDNLGNSADPNGNLEMREVA